MVSTTKRSSKQHKASYFLTSWRYSQAKIFDHFCSLRRACLSLLQHHSFDHLHLRLRDCLLGSLGVCSSASLYSRAAVDASCLDPSASRRKFSRCWKKRWKEMKHTHTTICLWGGFFNALLANLIYISGRLISLVKRG
jgi:hypothetical protein